MARAKRHIGFGKWVVEDDGKRVFGPVTKEQAEAWIEAERSKPGDAMTVLEKSRAYIERMNADLARPFAEERAELREVLLKRRDADETELLLRLFEPMLKAGKQAARRERVRYLRPAPKAA